MTSIIIPLNRTLVHREFEFSRKKYLNHQSERIFVQKIQDIFDHTVPLLLILALKFKYLKKKYHELYLVKIKSVRFDNLIPNSNTRGCCNLQRFEDHATSLLTTLLFTSLCCQGNRA